MNFSLCVASLALSVLPTPLTEGTADEPALDLARAQTLLDRLGAHVAKTEGDAVAAMFDPKGLHELLDDQTLLPTEPEMEFEIFTELINGAFLPRLLPGLAWTSCEVRNVRVRKGKEEAVVYAVHQRERGPAARMLWFLNRVEGQWLVEDFQDVSRAMRWSTSVGLGLKMSDKADPLVQTMPELMYAMQRSESGASDAIEKLEKLEGNEYPPALESMRQLRISELYAERRAWQACLAAAENSLAFGESSPNIYLVTAQAHNGLGSHDQALSFLEVYLSLLEPTAGTDAAQGDAWRGLGQSEDALAAYRSGLGREAGNPDCLLGLVRTLGADGDEELRTAWSALGKGSNTFRDLANLCVSEKDAAALGRILTLQRGMDPEHEDLARFEQALSELGD